jgi:serine/threonine protein kinase
MGHPEGLPEDQIRGVMGDIVEGIQGIINLTQLTEELHARGIMHRDLKLSNILLDKSMRTVISFYVFLTCRKSQISDWQGLPMIRRVKKHIHSVEHQITSLQKSWLVVHMVFQVISGV